MNAMAITCSGYASHKCHSMFCHILQAMSIVDGSPKGISLVIVISHNHIV